MDALVGALTGGTPAPYGKACTNCVKAKCRCIYRVSGPDCERCHRLAKECIPSVSVRKRNGRRPHVSRAAQLEEKIEDLVTLLRNQSTSGPVPGQHQQHQHQLPHEHGPSTIPSISLRPPLPGSEIYGNIDVSIDPGLSTPTPSQASSNNHVETDDIHGPARALCKPQGPQRMDYPGTLIAQVFKPPYLNDHPGGELLEEMGHGGIPSFEIQPSPHEAEENLNTFRKYMLTFLPFVYLPSGVTAKRLQCLYPFFWYNVMTITCKQVDRQLMMSDAIRRFVAQKMVIEHEKSLDLLWGLLTFMAWAHYYRKEKPCFSLLASLAKSLVYDFGLNKPPKDAHVPGCLQGKIGPPPLLKDKTIAERRAVLSCFLLTSQVSHLMQRVDALVWTPFMDECLKILSERPEWNGDEVLVALVRIQLLVEQLTRAVWQSSENAPPGFFVSALKTQLYDLKAQFPPHIQQNPAVLSHLYATELAILQSVRMKPKNNAASLVPDLQRYENLQASLEAVQKWFDNHLAVPSYMHIGFTFMHLCTLGHGFTAISMLAFEIQDPTWDCRVVKERIDIFGLVDRVIQAFDEVSVVKRRESGPSIEEDAFTRCAKLARLIKQNWLVDTMAMDQSLPQGMTVAPSDTFGGHTAESLSMPLFQLQDTAMWMREFFEMDW